MGISFAHMRSASQMMPLYELLLVLPWGFSCLVGIYITICTSFCLGRRVSMHRCMSVGVSHVYIISVHTHLNVHLILYTDTLTRWHKDRQTLLRCPNEPVAAPVGLGQDARGYRCTTVQRQALISAGRRGGSTRLSYAGFLFV